MASIGWAEGSIDICVEDVEGGVDAGVLMDTVDRVCGDCCPYLQPGDGACVVLIGSEGSKGGRCASMALKSAYFDFRTKGLGLALLDILDCWSCTLDGLFACTMKFERHRPFVDMARTSLVVS